MASLGSSCSLKIRAASRPSKSRRRPAASTSKVLGNSPAQIRAAARLLDRLQPGQRAVHHLCLELVGSKRSRKFGPLS